MVFLIRRRIEMLERLTVNLTTAEREALEKAANYDVRGLRDEARFFIYQELLYRGLLSMRPDSAQLESIREVQSREVSDATH
jgi:hypothetical protein